MDRQSLSSAFSDIEDQYGLPAGYLDQTAEIESRHNPRSYNELSKAKGMFQFIPTTAKDYGLKNPWDPIASADAAARYAVKNQSALRDALGRDPTAGELYLAHQQGTDGAIRLLSNPNAPAGRLVKRKNISANGGNPNAPASQFADKWTSRYADVDSMHGRLMAFNQQDALSGDDAWDKQFFSGSAVSQKDYGGKNDPLLQRYQPGKGGVPVPSKDDTGEKWYGSDKDPLLTRYGQKPKGIEVEAKPVKTTKESQFLTPNQMVQQDFSETFPKKDQRQAADVRAHTIAKQSEREGSWAVPLPTPEQVDLIKRHPYLVGAGVTGLLGAAAAPGIIPTVLGAGIGLTKLGVGGLNAYNISKLTDLLSSGDTKGKVLEILQHLQGGSGH